MMRQQHSLGLFTFTVLEKYIVCQRKMYLSFSLWENKTTTTKNNKHYSVVSACSVAMYIFVHVLKCTLGRISLGHTTKDGVCGSQDVSYLF